jgi:hypothetical protein
MLEHEPQVVRVAGAEVLERPGELSAEDALEVAPDDERYQGILRAARRGRADRDLPALGLRRFGREGRRSVGVRLVERQSGEERLRMNRFMGQ